MKGEAQKAYKQTSQKQHLRKISIENFKSRLLARGDPNNLINLKTYIKFTESSATLKQKINTLRQILPLGETLFNGKIALNTKPAFPMRNLQGATTYSFKIGKSLNYVFFRAKMEGRGQLYTG